MSGPGIRFLGDLETRFLILTSRPSMCHLVRKKILILIWFWFCTSIQKYDRCPCLFQCFKVWYFNTRYGFLLYIFTSLTFPWSNIRFQLILSLATFWQRPYTSVSTLSICGHRTSHWVTKVIWNTIAANTMVHGCGISHHEIERWENIC